MDHQKKIKVEDEKLGEIEYVQCSGCANYFFPADLISDKSEKICMICALRRGVLDLKQFESMI